MNEADLRALLPKIGISPSHTTSEGWIVCSCPFAKWTHRRGTDRKPSFVVHSSAGKSGYYCFSCKEQGSLPKLVSSLEFRRGESFGGLAASVAMQEALSFGDDYEFSHVDDEDPEPLNESIYGDMYDPVNLQPAAMEYLDSRGISEDAQAEADLRYDPEQQRILAPIRDSYGDLYGFTGRLIIEDPKRPKIKNYSGLKKEKFLLGEPLMQKGKPIILVEGIFGWLHLLTLEVQEDMIPVACMGSKLSDTQANLLIENNSDTYLLFDRDSAGDSGLFGNWDSEKGAFKGGGAIDKLKSEVPTYLVPWASGKSDPDELNISEFSSMISAAKLQQ